jgi:hypothetical protein
VKHVLVVGTAALALAVSAPAAFCQAVLDNTEEIDFDRPVLDEESGTLSVESRNDALFNLRAMFSYAF